MLVKSVQHILDKPFKCFSKEEQLEIAKKGRFTDLTNLCQNDKGKYRMFAVNWYQRVKWLTGNTVNNKLYCWSCILFPTGASKIWNTTGFDDLKNLSQSIKKHEETKEHTYSTVKLKLLLKEKRVNDFVKVVENNAKIKRNREYLERLIDVAATLAHFEIPFRNNNDQDGLYKHFLDLLSKYDDIVRTYMDDNSSFKGVTKTIQLDLIQSVANAVKQKIVEEVSEANFFSLQMDEVISYKICRQVAVSIRYVKEAEPVERFIGLYEIRSNKKTEDFVAILETELEKFNFKDKLVSQSYDGGVVKYTELYNIQQAVKKAQGYSTHCQLVHSWTHDMNEILAQSLRSIQECKLFFSMIKLFCSFFKNIALIDVLPNVPPTWTDSVYGCISTIHKNHLSLIQVLEFIIATDEYASSPEIISQAINLLNHLKSFKFMLFIYMFQAFFSFIQTTFDYLQTKAYDAVICRKKINKLIEKLKLFKSESAFKTLLSSVPSTTGQQIIVTGMLDLQAQILDHIVYELEGRFLDVDLGECWKIISLENLSKQSNGNKHPETSQLATLKENYPNYFDSIKLKSELDLFYSDPSILGIEDENIPQASQMLKFMYDHEINTCLPELYKLLELMVTIPFLSRPLEGSESVLNRIKNYCKSEKSEDPRSDLAFLVIESKLFCDMKKSSEWYQKVIDIFSSLPSTSSIDLTYKNTDISQPPNKCEIILDPTVIIKSDPDLNLNALL